MIRYPKISIVTPSYNQGKYIEQTIRSIINQGYPNLEYIIIDGGSTDNTIEIIKKYESHISYWVSERDNGQSDAINKGLRKCTGDIFNWINSDDYLQEDALFKIAEYFIKNPSTDMLCGWCSFFGEDTLPQKLQHRTEIFETVEETLAEQRINQPASFYKLSIIKSLGGVNEQLHYVMDLDLWFRYLCSRGQDKILLVDDLFAYFRLHNQSKTVSVLEGFRDEEKLLWHHLLMTLKIDQSISSFFKTSKSYNNSIDWKYNAINKHRLISSLCRKHIFHFYQAKNFKAAKAAFINQLKAGNIRLQRNYVGMFYHLFLNPFPSNR
jgi:glycosyltransferase involved in cell wall biosynthesis